MEGMYAAGARMHRSGNIKRGGMLKNIKAINFNKTRGEFFF